MNKCSLSLTRLAGACVLLAALPMSSFAAADYYQGWDTGTRSLGWIKNASGNVITRELTGGNGGGAITSTRVSGNKYIGFWSGRIDSLLGDYSGKDWTVSFDLKLDQGTFTSARLRYVHLDGPDDGTTSPAVYRGWYYSFADAVAAGNGVWSSNSVSFNGSWTDAEAIANGWVLEGPRSRSDTRIVLSWADTMKSAYKNEVQLFTSTTAGKAWLDNFRQTGVAAPTMAAVTAVPEPASIAMMAAGLGLVGVIAARRRRTGDC